MQVFYYNKLFRKANINAMGTALIFYNCYHSDQNIPTSEMMKPSHESENEPLKMALFPTVRYNNVAENFYFPHCLFLRFENMRIDEKLSQVYGSE